MIILILKGDSMSHKKKMIVEHDCIDSIDADANLCGPTYLDLGGPTNLDLGDPIAEILLIEKNNVPEINSVKAMHSDSE